MTKHTVKFKQDNMLCHRCVLNAIKVLSQVDGIKELKVDIDTKIIKIIHGSSKLSRELIKEAVNESITTGKFNKFTKLH